MLDVLAQPALWQALTTSLRIAIASTMPGMARISMPLSSIACPASGRWRARSSRLLHSSMLLPPLLAVIVDGVNRNMLDVLAQPALWQALTTSPLSRLCRRSSGSRQPRTWLTPIATALLRRWLSSTSFASFATVLSLGGGPKATTIELAIYQALSFDYDPRQGHASRGHG
jgi:hypothetical protein